MLADIPTELSRIKLKNLNLTARPYDQRAFSPLDPTISWLSHLALAIYIFVVVNSDALAQASDIQIERRQVVLLCWKLRLLSKLQWSILLHTKNTFMVLMDLLHRMAIHQIYFSITNQEEITNCRSILVWLLWCRNVLMSPFARIQDSTFQIDVQIGRNLLRT